MTRRLCLAAIVLVLAAACSRPEPVDTAAAASPSPSPELSPSPTMPVTLAGPVNFLGMTDVTGQGSKASVDIAVSDEGFNPTFVKVSPLAQVTVRLSNSGTQDRTFTIDSLGVDQELPAGGNFSISALSPSPSPAQSAPATELTFQLPADGVIVFYDKNGRESGAQGAFYFAEGQGESPVPEADSASVGGSSSSGGSSTGSRSGSSGSSSRRSSGGGTSSGGGGNPIQNAFPPNPGGDGGGSDPLDAQIMCAVDPSTCPPEKEETEPKTTQGTAADPNNQSQRTEDAPNAEERQGSSGSGGGSGDEGKNAPSGEAGAPGRHGADSDSAEVDIEEETGADGQDGSA